MSPFRSLSGPRPWPRQMAMPPWHHAVQFSPSCPRSAYNCKQYLIIDVRQVARWQQRTRCRHMLVNLSSEDACMHHNSSCACLQQADNSCNRPSYAALRTYRAYELLPGSYAGTELTTARAASRRLTASAITVHSVSFNLFDTCFAIRL